MTEEALFHEAMSQPASERAAFLASACAGRPELHAAIVALLAAHEASRNPLDQTVDSGPTGRTSATLDFSPGDHAGSRPNTATGAVIAGRYTLVEKLGEGGMGEVWVAQQTEPVKRRVALKLIKSGMDSASVLVRFEAERQALALMDHPNIARVLDGGVTSSGQPFFVMELVEGQPLTAFCDSAQLTLRQRLELFVAICQAVQHAHTKGVVHRDLKPANILVTVIDGKPVPKVIDFGVAKATGGLTGSDHQTQAGAVIGTLDYMAPEQAGTTGEDIDTRADVYSLGVILYELLTGTRPLDSQRLKQANLVEIVRAIREEEPARPSTRVAPAQARAMAGELDWIALRCLEKDRARRYESASDLARDVQRYLADEPVEARPPTFGYRLRKTLWRNRVAVAAVGAVVAALVLGLGLAVWQAVVATQAQAAAIRLAGEKGQLADANADLAQKEGQAKVAALQATRAKDEQLRRTQAVLFNSQIERAGLLRESNLWGAVGLLYDLNFCPVEHRDVAWNVAVKQALQPRLGSMPLSGTVAAFSPDGRIVASVALGAQTTIRLRDLATGTALPPIPLPGVNRDQVERLVFSPDGLVLAVLVDGPLSSVLPATPGSVRLCKVAERQWLAPLTGHTDRVTCVAFSPDGKRLASGSLDGTVRIWDRATGKTTHTLGDHGKAVGAVAFSPDGKRLASGGSNSAVRLWDTATFQALAAWKVDAKSLFPGGNVPPPAFGGECIVTLDFSPNGKTLAVGSTSRVVELREAASGDVLSGVYDLPDVPRSLQFHRDGRSVFIAASIVGQWDAGSGRPLRAFLPAGTGAFSRAGARVVASSGAYNETAILYDLDLSSETASLPLEKEAGPRPAAAFTPQGALLAAAGKDGVVVWDLANRTVRDVLAGHRNHATAVAIAPSGTLLASADRTTFERPGTPASVRLWDLATGETLVAFDLGAADVRSLAFSPDGRTLASFHWERIDPQALPVPVLSLWDVDRHTLRHRLAVPTGRWEAVGPDRVTLAFHPDGSALLLANARELSIFNLATRQVERQILVGSPGDSMRGGPSFLDMAISPDGQRIITVNLLQRTGPELNLWDYPTGELLHKINAGPGSLAGYSVRFSHDSKTVLVGTEAGVRFLDVQTMQARGLLPVPGTRSQAVVLSPDGRTLAAIPISFPWFDNSREVETVPVRLWDVGPPATRLLFPGRFDRDQVVLSRDRRTVIDTSSNGQVHLWDADTGALRLTIDVTRQAVGNQQSPDGRYLIGHKHDPSILDPEKSPATVTLFDLRELAFQSFDLGPGKIQGLSFSQDSTLLIVQRPPLGIQVIDLEARTIGPVLKPSAFGGVRFNRDKTRLLIKNGGQTTVWDWRTGKAVDEPIPEDVPHPRPMVGEPRYRLVATPLGTTLVDQHVQPPPVSGKQEKQP